MIRLCSLFFLFFNSTQTQPPVSPTDGASERPRLGTEKKINYNKILLYYFMIYINNYVSHSTISFRLTNTHLRR